MLDKSKSAQVGASGLLVLHRGVCVLENRYLRTRWFHENGFGKKALGVSYRLGKTILLDDPLDHLAILVQHEVFGHGARYREFGYSGNTYELNLVPPYGDGRGRTIPGRSSANRIVPADEQIAMTIGGCEANTLLSNSVRDKWLHRGSMNYRETVVYLFACNDLSAYILRTRYEAETSGENDILNYLRLINRRHGYPGTDDYLLTLDGLRKQVLVNTLNPFQYFSLYTYFATYLWAGEESYEFPMLSLWNMKYLPSCRLGLTPFGSEFRFENLIVSSEKTINFAFRYGVPTFHDFWGLSLKADNLIHNRNLSVNVSLNIWHQPSLLLGGSTVTWGKAGLGGALSGTIFWNMLEKDSFVNLAAQIGHKTTGFVEGEKLDKGFFGRIGISFVEL